MDNNTGVRELSLEEFAELTPAKPLALESVSNSMGTSENAADAKRKTDGFLEISSVSSDTTLEGHLEYSVLKDAEKLVLASRSDGLDVENLSSIVGIVQVFLLAFLDDGDKPHCQVELDLAMATSSLNWLQLDQGLRAHVAEALVPTSKMKVKPSATPERSKCQWEFGSRG
ncbi:uncharacterized protein BJ212DRAFT_1585493 [Suillus subaureus]|uniref:Uncharacterized protein n=1 Tax=Suillus subaureus TaxID=48587 RepID=A0A9P7EJM8_9AGAM|nr:uncharacterized protein BJ212DRAFT_1585493 [Suillus subaureus]KAG1822831.1 hypothetical protein BJ212DRAFT_1585493 [Suillus subaureus]